MAKQELKTRQTDIAAKGANGRQVEQTYTVDDNCLPAPQELEHYKSIDPRIIDFLITTTEKEQDFRHDFERKKLKSYNLSGKREFRINVCGMFLAALIMLVGLALSAFLIYCDKIIIGSIFGGVTLAIAASIFVQRGEKKKG